MKIVNGWFPLLIFHWVCLIFPCDTLWPFWPFPKIVIYHIYASCEYLWTFVWIFQWPFPKIVMCILRIFVNICDDIGGGGGRLQYVGGERQQQGQIVLLNKYFFIFFVAILSQLFTAIFCSILPNSLVEQIFFIFFCYFITFFYC